MVSQLPDGDGSGGAGFQGNYEEGSSWEVTMLGSLERRHGTGPARDLS